jgi:Gpi18-like mannosyltransferase
VISLVWEKINAWYNRVPYSLKIALVVALVAKIAIYIIGYTAAYSTALTHGYSTEPTGLFLNMFDHWDGPHYLYLAQYGYTNQGDPANFIVFFPLYPLLVRLLTVDFNFVNLSGLIVSNVASIVAVIYLFKLVKLDYTDSVAKKAVLFLCVFPTAYFMSAPFTEALFLVLVIASLYYARNANWALAGFLGCLSALTRIGGLVLVPALLVEYFHQRGWKFKASDYKILFSLLPAVGFMVYLGINYVVMGDFLSFLTVQREHFHETFGPINGLKGAWNWPSYNVYPDSITIGYAEIIFAAFGLAMVLAALKLKLRPSYQVYMLFTWAVTVSTSFWISVPRYVLAMFPLFIVLALVSSKKPVMFAILAAFGVGLFFFTWLFGTGAWAF